MAPLNILMGTLVDGNLCRRNLLTKSYYFTNLDVSEIARDLPSKKLYFLGAQKMCEVDTYNLTSKRHICE